MFFGITTEIIYYCDGISGNNACKNALRVIQKGYFFNSLKNICRKYSDGKFSQITWFWKSKEHQKSTK